MTDVMLQERLYPKWARWARAWWRVGVRRIVVFWVVTFSAFFVVLLVIATGQYHSNRSVPWKPVS